MATAAKHTPSNVLLKRLGRLVKKFHLTIFFIFVIGCLAWAVLLINNLILSDPTDTGYVPPIDAGSIDQSSLNSVQSLHTSGEAPEPAPLPEGRINPFGE